MVSVIHLSDLKQKLQGGGAKHPTSALTGIALIKDFFVVFLSLEIDF